MAPQDDQAHCGQKNNWPFPNQQGGTLMKTHNRLVKRFFAALLFSILVLVFPNSPAADSLKDGAQAHAAGDYKKALEIFKPLAEQGKPEAQYNLGVMYERGRGVAQDYAEAVKWYRKAAKQGFAYAQYNLGVMYDNGRGVSQDYAEAVKWYHKASEQGYAMAQYNLGSMHQNGQGVPQDYTEAVKWYRRAAEQGILFAQFNLAIMYINGRGVRQDYVEGHKWLDLVTFRLPPSDKKKLAQENRDIVERKMTQSQIEKAQKLAREWKPKPNKSP